jgi:hypothetical protein
MLSFHTLLYVESKIDPRISADKIKIKLLQAGEDMETILAWALERGGDWEHAESIRVLQRVLKENYQTDESGQRQPRRAQPSGAVHNPAQSVQLERTIPNAVALKKAKPQLFTVSPQGDEYAIVQKGNV